MNLNTTKEIENLHYYLQKNIVSFGRSRNLLLVGYAFYVYGITNYMYKLNISGIDYTKVKQSPKMQIIEPINCDDVYIRDIPQPTNEIEEQLYPFIVSYLSPSLPIKIGIITTLYNENTYNLVIENKELNILIGINSFDDAYVNIYYLDR